MAGRAGHASTCATARAQVGRGVLRGGGVAEGGGRGGRGDAAVLPRAPRSRSARAQRARAPEPLSRTAPPTPAAQLISSAWPPLLLAARVRLRCGRAHARRLALRRRENRGAPARLRQGRAAGAGGRCGLGARGEPAAHHVCSPEPPERARGAPLHLPAHVRAGRCWARPHCVCISAEGHLCPAAIAVLSAACGPGGQPGSRSTHADEHPKQPWAAGKDARCAGAAHLAGGARAGRAAAPHARCALPGHGRARRPHPDARAARQVQAAAAGHLPARCRPCG